MLEVSKVDVYGLERAIITSRYPKVEDVDEYWKNLDDKSYAQAEKCIKTLANTGGAEAHDQVLTGITVTFDLKASMQFWPEFQRYKFVSLNFISSTSKMHKLSKMALEKCCNDFVDEQIIHIAEQYQEAYNQDAQMYKEGKITKEELDYSFYYMVYNIPLGFELTAGMITNYRCLRNIYRQRRNHRLEEWQVFCDWIESLSMSDELITVGLKEGRKRNN